MPSNTRHITSFTEPDLEVTSVDGEHSNYINGKKVYGGSTFKKNFTEPFNKWIKVNSAKSWNISVDQVSELWGDKRDSTAKFGSVIHALIEDTINNVEPRYDRVEKTIKDTRVSYLKNLDIGEHIHKIRLSKGKESKENYAKPTHLDIRALMKSTSDEILKYSKNIVSEFKLMFEKARYNLDNALAEVYVTYSPLNMGGEIDVLYIIDSEKKICRVQDHKIKDKVLDELTSRNALINELAKKKASELDVIRIQLSFYAFCLSKAGWTVEGGDVFGRNGEWKHYKIDLIPTDEMERLLIKYLK